MARTRSRLAAVLKFKSRALCSVPRAGSAGGLKRSQPPNTSLCIISAVLNIYRQGSGRRSERSRPSRDFVSSKSGRLRIRKLDSWRTSLCPSEINFSIQDEELKRGKSEKGGASIGSVNLAHFLNIGYFLFTAEFLRLLILSIEGRIW